MIDIDNGVYNGDWNSGKRQGNGDLVYWNGDKYTGDWECDLKSGFGILDEEEEHYEGNFNNDMKNGYGEQKFLKKAFYKGNFVDGLFEVNGKLVRPAYEYEGEFSKGKFHGKGFLNANIWSYSGDFVNGHRSGYGTFKDFYGKFTSWWENDRPIGYYRCITTEGKLKCGKWWMFTPVNYYDQILPNLYIGTAEIAADEPYLRLLKIKFIVRVLNDENFEMLPGFIYYHLKAKDDKDEDIINRMDGALDFIKGCIEKNENVFVYCYRGISRSPTVVIAYLMKMQGMTYKDAYQFTKSKRPCINPNEGFVK